MVDHTLAGACGCEKETGDGAGMLLAIPDKLYRKVCSFELPPKGQYSAGICYFPKNEEATAKGKKVQQLPLWQTFDASCIFHACFPVACFRIVMFFFAPTDP